MELGVGSKFNQTNYTYAIGYNYSEKNDLDMLSPNMIGTLTGVYSTVNIPQHCLHLRLLNRLCTCWSIRSSRNKEISQNFKNYHSFRPAFLSFSVISRTDHEAKFICIYSQGYFSGQYPLYASKIHGHHPGTMFGYHPSKVSHHHFGKTSGHHPGKVSSHHPGKVITRVRCLALPWKGIGSTSW